MVIRLDENYNAMTSTALLGYVGETNARPVSVEGLTVDGADRYVLTIDYGDGTVYEVDITGGQWTPTADILRSAQTISCQIAAKKLAGNEYVLVKKSRIFRLRIGAAIGDTAIPSPDVAMDALDRIDAIGKQAHADMQTAVNAAETATTAAENAKKSATAAEKSADTATQAAERAETAKAAAETSATQAETARAEAVTAQNAAKISADLAASAAQQTTADKTATAGYAQTAKTNADSTAADRQAVQTLAEQVTADKATVEENTAKVAEDRTAAETAAQTAQAVADSLPDDYVTAVAKIAENTADIASIKLADKEMKRRVDALYDIGQGITHKFETDSETAYAKTVPTGAKLMSVKNVGGRSIVFNQLADAVEVADSTVDFYYAETEFRSNRPKWAKGHKYFMKFYAKSDIEPFSITIGYSSAENVLFDMDGEKFVNRISGWQTLFYTPSDSLIDDRPYIALRPVRYPSLKHFTYSVNSLMIVDLTILFGSGNEPSTVEEFEKIFPADYYPYNAGEIVSAGVTEVAVGDTAHQIPEAIRNLPGYGWSAGTAKNWVDYENKKYYHCVSSVDLGTLTWAYNPNTNIITARVNGIKAPTTAADRKDGIICSEYPTSDTLGLNTSMRDKSMLHVEDFIAIRDTSYSNDASFKAAMQGVMLYYELETPIVTDISNLIPDDFLRNIEVEAGGSITFKNSNGDDYKIPVPSEEEYIVKLSEVGGTT